MMAHTSTLILKLKGAIKDKAKRKLQRSNPWVSTCTSVTKVYGDAMVRSNHLHRNTSESGTNDKRQYLNELSPQSGAIPL